VRSARTTATGTPAAIAPTRAAPSVAVERITLALLTRHQIDQVKELAALLGALRSSLALHDAHEPHLTGPASHDVESLHQTRETITFELQSSADRLGLGAFAQSRLGSGSFGSRFDGRAAIRGRSALVDGFDWSRAVGGRRALVDRFDSAVCDGGITRGGRFTWSVRGRGGFGGGRVGATVVGLRVLCPK